MIAAFLLWLTSKMPAPRVIQGGTSGAPYLSRWYLIGEKPSTDVHGNPVASRNEDPAFQLYLHRFHRSDDDAELHCHPWKWAIALVLAGGYYEEKRVGDQVFSFARRPFSINVIRADDYHRVDLIGVDSWSLFLAGPKAGSWFFWCRRRLARAPWRAFLAWKQDGGEQPKWEPDSRGGK